jgi:tRNA(Leu) C34 or U34 (ribose-2'-O)-methylase TrmL
VLPPCAAADGVNLGLGPNAERERGRCQVVTVVLQRVKYSHNLAAAIRAAACFGADNVLYTGERFAFKDGERLPREERMKGYSSVRFEATERPFDWVRERMVRPGREFRAVTVCVELTPSATALSDFIHPATATTYVFGPEDGHVSQAFRGLCGLHVYIPAKHCLNLAAAVNVVLAHRAIQLGQRWTPAETEGRGIIEVPGWEGK